MKKHVLVACMTAFLISSITLPSISFAADDSVSKSAAESALVTTVASAASAPAGSALFRDDFEGELQGSWYREMADTDYSGTISKNYAASGSNSFRIELNKSDPIINGSKRSELTLMKREGPLEERTYSFSTLLPDGGDEDFAVDPEGSEVIAQWHNTPDDGEEWTYPPLALHTYKGHYELWRIWDDAKMSTDEQIMDKGNFVRHDLGSYVDDKGRFVQWTFKVKWGWLDSQNPRIQVYKDGELILDVEGPNTTNDEEGTVLKLGIYKWDWAQGKDNTSILSNRVIYYDNVSVK